MDTPNKLNAPRERGSCSWQTTRDAGFARRLCALLSTAAAQADTEIVRAISMLMSKDVLRDVEDPTEAISRDGEWALLSLRLVRRFEEWSLVLVVQSQVNAFDDTQDCDDVTAVALQHGTWSVGLDLRTGLSANEIDYLSERVEAARAWVKARCHDDDVSCAEERT